MYDPKKDHAFTDNPYLTDYQLMNDPCDNPNPPGWCTEGGGGCNNPNHPEWCDGIHESVPIEPGVFMLFISLMFGVALIKKRFVFSRK